MIRVKGKYRDQKVELDQPLNLAEDTEVELLIQATGAREAPEPEGWSELGMDRLAAEWDNPQDAVYDNWRELYGVERR